MRAVPEVRLAVTSIESDVLLCVLSIFNTSYRRRVYYSFTRGEAALGPRAFFTKFPVFVSWIGGLLVRFMVSEETSLTS